MRLLRGLFRICFIFIFGLQMGCSDTEEVVNQGTTVTSVTKEAIRADSISIPFQEHLYSKNSANFTWEWSNTEDLSQEIMAKYDEYKHAVPGGFIVKETLTDFFICVSIGLQDSVTNGFSLSNLTLADEYEDGISVLLIDVTRVKENNLSDEELKEEFNVRSLISIRKEDIPEGRGFQSISLRWNE